MIVKKLIEALESLPQNADVFAPNLEFNDSLEDVVSVTLVERAKCKSFQEYYQGSPLRTGEHAVVLGLVCE